MCDEGLKDDKDVWWVAGGAGCRRYRLRGHLLGRALHGSVAGGMALGVRGCRVRGQAWWQLVPPCCCPHAAPVAQLPCARAPTPAVCSPPLCSLRSWPTGPSTCGRPSGGVGRHLQQRHQIVPGGTRRQGQHVTLAVTAARRWPAAACPSQQAACCVESLQRFAGSNEPLRLTSAPHTPPTPQIHEI